MDKNTNQPFHLHPPASGATPRVLITAGPTHEPIDSVRFLGNRSSGRLGVALADEATRRGWPTTLLLGPTHRTPTDSRVQLRRFRTAADLEELLAGSVAECDVLIMAAAVADYRPRVDAASFGGKFRRTNETFSLLMEPTPDLLAGVASRKGAHQLFVGFALEPREEMIASARAKLERKKIDLIVANPLETMDGGTIEAAVIGADGSERRTDGAVPKERFAPWLMNIVQEHLARIRR